MFEEGIVRLCDGCVRFVPEFGDQYQLSGLDGDPSNHCRPDEDFSRCCPLLLGLIGISVIIISAF